MKKALGFVVVVAMACTADVMTNPHTVPKTTFVVAGTPVNGDAVLSEFRVCKVGFGAGIFTVSRTPFGTGFGGGSTILADAVVAPGQCLVVVEDDAGDQGGSNVTVTEVNSANLTSITGLFAGINGVVPISPDPVNGATFFINSFHGITLTFTNAAPPPPPPPPPPPGAEGCTPGYWKQTQHFDSWPVPLATTFADAGMDFGFTGTLLSGLEAGGGEVNALARHAAAAYLNSLSTGVDFSLTTAEVIAIANGTGVYSGLSIEERKDLLADANESVCPLN